LTALALDSVSVILGGKCVVDRISAEVAAGEWVAVIGPNGAGKTTLLRAVAGLVPYAGAVDIFGQDGQRLGRRELARRVAVVPQVPLVPADLTVREYVLLGRTPHLGYLSSESRSDRDAAESALERLDLVAFARRRLDSLSGGERQRAILARALAQDAPILLLDEPTAALDVGRQQQVLELVDTLRATEGLTVVSAMHDLTLASEYADRLLLLSAGELVADGFAQDVLTEQAIADHYGAAVRVIADNGTAVAVIPARPSRSRPLAPDET
jgi:iron complex transport system ATP-binding protein